jgi:2-oxoglutarate ferredoxin oxidoreductase subunit beta
MVDQATHPKLQVNLIGLEKADYRGNPTTLCQGCGHNSIASQIITACYELNIHPELASLADRLLRQSPAYFLGRSFAGFNGLHGRMPPWPLEPFRRPFSD